MDKGRNGLEIAFGITSYEEMPVDGDEQDYGSIIAVMKSWDTEGGNIVKFTPLESRKCDIKEIGLGPLGFEDP